MMGDAAAVQLIVPGLAVLITGTACAVLLKKRARQLLVIWATMTLSYVLWEVFRWINS